MLVIFKSQAAADMMMFEENAKQILRLLGKESNKGIITSAETETAIAIIEKEIERQKQIEAEKEKREKKKKNQDNDSHTGKKNAFPPEPSVSFSARAYPFLQLLKAAHKQKKDVYWGV